MNPCELFALILGTLAVMIGLGIGATIMGDHL